ncbi:hypothetical protein MMC18_003181 [Xylographa bjoerkii]|nr:hypothetical protein [Xylographa bjoerkii]
MSNEPVRSFRRMDRQYHEYENSFLKKTIAPHKYEDKPCLTHWNKERLKNEAACLRFIELTTNIPVPKVLFAHEKNGSYHLCTERVPGVCMNDLSQDKQAVVIEEVERHLQTLKCLKSDRIDGPSDIICPAHRAAGL